MIKWLMGAIGALLILLKLKSSQAEVKEEKIKTLEAEISFVQVEDEVTNQIKKELKEEEAEIEAKYEVQRKAIESLGDIKLSDELILLLQERRGIRNSTRTTTE